MVNEAQEVFNWAVHSTKQMSNINNYGKYRINRINTEHHHHNAIYPWSLPHGNTSQRKVTHSLRPIRCRCAACGELFTDFCENTTLHGLKYIGEKDRHITERLFWTVAVILAVATAAYLIKDVYINWTETPVIVSIGAEPTPVTDIPFPAVTICPMDRIFHSTGQKIIESESPDDDVYKKLLNDYCNERQHPETNTTESWEIYVKFLKKIRQPCTELLDECFFKGYRYNCTELFKPYLTDGGICCTFNRVKYDLMYRNKREVFATNESSQFLDYNWSPEVGYQSNTSYNAIPLRSRVKGSQEGLMFTVNRAEFPSFCLDDDFTFKLQIHSPIEEAKFGFFDAKSIMPTAIYFIRLEPRITTSAPSLASVNVKERRCFFSNERYLKFYRTYSHENCLEECEANFTLAKCKCVPYYLPMDNNTVICGQTKMNCIRNTRAAFSNAQSPFTVKMLAECNCLQSCNSLKYTWSSDLEFMRRPVSHIYVFFAENEFTNNYKSQIFGLSDFLASTGGLLGLFFGFSFLSIVEMIYFLTIRLWIGIIKRDKESK